jgi:hypothetical protein
MKYRTHLARTESRAMNRLVRLLPIIILIAATTFIVDLSLSPEAHRVPRQCWIVTKYGQLEENMPLNEVYELLGRDGDFRVDPEKSDRERQPLLPFAKPSRAPVNWDILWLQFGLRICYYWRWDFGTIVIHFDGGETPRLRSKALDLSDGPRHPLSRALDPLRIWIYN